VCDRPLWELVLEVQVWLEAPLTDSQFGMFQLPLSAIGYGNSLSESDVPSC
jgi:hypothetical protein